VSLACGAPNELSSLAEKGGAKYSIYLVQLTKPHDRDKLPGSNLVKLYAGSCSSRLFTISTHLAYRARFFARSSGVLISRRV
jgi:hypothetical protein